MKIVRYSVAMSLDGFIAGPKGEYDWIPMDPEIDFQAFMDRFDTVLLGRKSYQASAGGTADPGPDVFAGKAVYVFSTTLPAQDGPDRVVSPDPVATVTELRNGSGKEIWLFGGGELFRTLLEARLVDRIEVAIVPILLGHGIPMLPAAGAPQRLVLENSTVYGETGMVLLEYRVAEES